MPNVFADTHDRFPTDTVADATPPRARPAPRLNRHTPNLALLGLTG